MKTEYLDNSVYDRLTKKYKIIKVIADSLGIEVSDVNENTWFVVKYTDDSGRGSSFKIGSTYMARFDVYQDNMFIVLDNKGKDETVFQSRVEVVKE